MADRIVDKFRKGGLFSVEPIKEEELEYSIDGIEEIDKDKSSPGNKIIRRFDEDGNPIEEEFDKDGYLVKWRLYDKDGKLK